MSMWDLVDKARQIEADSARLAVRWIATGRGQDAEFFVLDAGYQRALGHEIIATIDDLRPAQARRDHERRLRNGKTYGWIYCGHDDGHGYECGLRLDDGGRCVIHGMSTAKPPS